MSKNVLKPEDVELFRQKMEDVTPLAHKTVVSLKPSTKRTTHVLANKPDNAASLSRFFDSSSEPETATISGESVLQFRRSGIQNRVFRKLQRGQIPMTAELDLHGMTVYRAKIALDQFMERLNNSEKQCCIRIIHGKGHGSKDGLPVIKRQTQLWLQCNKKVLAYCSCPISEGGTGAIYVLVKHVT